ncbi:hypothetical protein V8C86DRAFT_1553898 [Haematococcus lacustris]
MMPGRLNALGLLLRSLALVAVQATAKPWGALAGQPPRTQTTNITRVHLVFSNHLDVGYTAHDNEVIDLYFREHLPRALQLAEAVRAQLVAQGCPAAGHPEANAATKATTAPAGASPGPPQHAQQSPASPRTPADPSSSPAMLSCSDSFTYTSHAWLLSLYLDCPPGLGVACPSPEQQEALRAGIRRGDVTWHAGPFNAQLELYDEGMLDAFLDIGQQLDKEFDQPTKLALSQRDIPGMTRGVIPGLLRRGVRLVSVGVNAATAPPAVPPVTPFIWREPGSGQEVVAMWHPGGYGGYVSASDLAADDLRDCVTAPDWDTALCVSWRNDNMGPPLDLAEYTRIMSHVRAQFSPTTQVTASSFQAYAHALLAKVDAGALQLPVFTGEVGDTWIHGAASDPYKLAGLRAAQRARAACIAAGDCDPQEAAMRNASRLLAKVAEHTWGLAIQQLDNWEAWSNQELDALAAARGPAYLRFTCAWERQARWLDYMREALGPQHPWAVAIRAAAGRRDSCSSSSSSSSEEQEQEQGQLHHPQQPGCGRCACHPTRAPEPQPLAQLRSRSSSSGSGGSGSNSQGGKGDTDRLPAADSQGRCLLPDQLRSPRQRGRAGRAAPEAEPEATGQGPGGNWLPPVVRTSLWEAELDMATGGFSRLVFHAPGGQQPGGQAAAVDWAGEGAQLGVPLYSLYSPQDFEQMLSHYSYAQPPWYQDFGKPNMASAGACSATLKPHFWGWSVWADASGSHLEGYFAFPSWAESAAGAPRSLAVAWTFPGQPLQPLPGAAACCLGGASSRAADTAGGAALRNGSATRQSGWGGAAHSSSSSSSSSSSREGGGSSRGAQNSPGCLRGDPAPPSPNTVQVRVEWQQKRPTRLAEAMWLQFMPGRQAVDPTSWRLHKLGTTVGLGEVVANGSQALHAVGDEGVTVRASSPARRTIAQAGGSTSRHTLHTLAAQTLDGSGPRPQLRMSSLDAALVSPGWPSALPNPSPGPLAVAEAGVSFCLVNNVWGTNYVMWWPRPQGNCAEQACQGVPPHGVTSVGDNMVFRFALSVDEAPTRS